LKNQRVRRAPIFGSAIAIARNREVVKAFGGVLNGLNGNFEPTLRGQKMNARTNQFWRFPFMTSFLMSFWGSERPNQSRVGALFAYI
jgi:hypothetical protein